MMMMRFFSFLIGLEDEDEEDDQENPDPQRYPDGPEVLQPLDERDEVRHSVEKEVERDAGQPPIREERVGLALPDVLDQDIDAQGG